jgi:hypothetical protein
MNQFKNLDEAVMFLVKEKEFKKKDLKNQLDILGYEMFEDGQYLEILEENHDDNYYRNFNWINKKGKDVNVNVTFAYPEENEVYVLIK